MNWLATICLMMQIIDLLYLKLKDSYPRILYSCEPFKGRVELNFEVDDKNSPQNIPNIEGKSFETYFETGWLENFSGLLFFAVNPEILGEF